MRESIDIISEHIKRKERSVREIEMFINDNESMTSANNISITLVLHAAKSELTALRSVKVDILKALRTRYCA